MLTPPRPTPLLPQKGGRVHAILLNERGAEQKIIEMVERRGIVVVRLMSQVRGARGT